MTHLQVAANWGGRGAEGGWQGSLGNLVPATLPFCPGKVNMLPPPGFRASARLLMGHVHHAHCSFYKTVAALNHF